MKKFGQAIIISILSLGLLVGCGSKTNNETSESKLTGSLIEIMEKTQEALKSPVMVLNEEVDLNDKDAVKYNLGLDSASGIKEAVAGNAMITTHAYATVLVRVDEGVNAEKVAKDMVSGVDLMKWICVGADDAQAAVYGDVIYLVMLDSNLEENDIAAHFEAFETVAGSKVDSIIKR